MSYVAILQEVKHAIRNEYAWPGGYPLFIMMSDGEALSCGAARKNWRQIASATMRHANDGWRAEGAAINWENTDLFCAHTGARIESAYGEAD